MTKAAIIGAIFAAMFYLAPDTQAQQLEDGSYYNPANAAPGYLVVWPVSSDICSVWFADEGSARDYANQSGGVAISATYSLETKHPECGSEGSK